MEFTLPDDELPKVLQALAVELPPEIPRETVFDAMARAWGDKEIVVPLAFLQRLRRNREMLRRFTGRNMLELCAEFGIHRRQFYRILNRFRSYRRKRQFSEPHNPAKSLTL